MFSVQIKRNLLNEEKRFSVLLVGRLKFGKTFKMSQTFECFFKKRKNEETFWSFDD